MSSKNDVTGDNIRSKVASDKYRDQWELIFGNKNKEADGLVEQRGRNDEEIEQPDSEN